MASFVVVTEILVCRALDTGPVFLHVGFVHRAAYVHVNGLAEFYTHDVLVAGVFVLGLGAVRNGIAFRHAYAFGVRGIVITPVSHTAFPVEKACPTCGDFVLALSGVGIAGLVRGAAFAGTAHAFVRWGHAVFAFCGCLVADVTGRAVPVGFAFSQAGAATAEGHAVEYFGAILIDFAGCAVSGFLLGARTRPVIRGVTIGPESTVIAERVVACGMGIGATMLCVEIVCFVVTDSGLLVHGRCNLVFCSAGVR